VIGATLQDKYKVEKKIGEGGFAQVYAGFDQNLKRPVAIKLLTEMGGSSFKRFLNEAEWMAGLNHANIVTIHDTAEYKGRPYIVMEYVNGPTMLELVSQAELTIPQVCTLALQVCAAMSYAHGKGVIHRDLSLRNIMVNKVEGDKQEVKIVDFGLAKLLHTDAATTGQEMMGTRFFMSPELIRNEDVDARVDIFAFGVGLFRMLNGRFPFEAEHPAALMYLILHESDISFERHVPAGLKDLVLQCLEKDPRERIRDFDSIIPQLRQALDDAESQGSGAVSTVSGLEAYAQRSSKRNPFLNRVMITNPSDFFGRSREVRKIYSRLDAPHPQSISVVGDRRIGKSSLLNYIYHSRNRRKHMVNNENAIFVYLDFQRSSDHDVPKFIDFLFNMFSYESKSGRDYTGREKTLDELKNVIQELHDEGQRIIVLMDEFESITKNQNFEESFFSFLRSLANSYRVAYVTSSYDDLQRMCYNKDISDSPFFNIFSNLPLRPFKRDEAVELITVLSSAEGVPLEAHAPRILEMAGLFPIFLQIACSNVFEYLVDNPEAEPDWKEIYRSFSDEIDQHYRFVWERMDDPSRENLGRIAAGKSINRKFEFVNEELERRGYLVDSDKGLNICSSSFKSFIAREDAQSGRKKGLLGFLGKRKDARG